MYELNDTFYSSASHLPFMLYAADSWTTQLWGHSWWLFYSWGSRCWISASIHWSSEIMTLYFPLSPPNVNWVSWFLSACNAASFALYMSQVKTTRKDYSHQAKTSDDITWSIHKHLSEKILRFISFMKEPIHDQSVQQKLYKHVDNVWSCLRCCTTVYHVQVFL